MSRFSREREKEREAWYLWQKKSKRDFWGKNSNLEFEKTRGRPEKRGGETGGERRERKRELLTQGYERSLCFDDSKTHVIDANNFVLVFISSTGFQELRSRFNQLTSGVIEAFKIIQA